MTILSVRQLIQQAKTRRMDNEDVETAESSSFRSPLLGCQLVRRGILHEEDSLERFRVKDAPSKVYVIDDFVLPEVAGEFMKTIQRFPHYKVLRGARRTLPLRIGVGDCGGLLDHLAEELVTSLPQLKELFNDGNPGLNHALVNDYERGCGGIMPHTDGPAYYPVVMIISLGSATVLQFGKSPDDQEAQVLLPARSLLIFNDEAYHEYLHSIPFNDTSIDAQWADGRDLGDSIVTDGVLHRGGRLSITLRRALVPFEQLARTE